jgi:2-C-methyl-D-erythritol 4-phosphate cytidylyltransferase
LNVAVIVAGGSGERLGGEVPKQLQDLGGRPILEWSVRAFTDHPEVDRVIVVLPPNLAVEPPGWIPAGVRAVAGGDTRARSVVNGVAAIDETEDAVVLVHDGVRPFVSAAVISRVIGAAGEGPVIPVVPVTDTLKTVDANGRVLGSPPRDGLRAAQTPQGFSVGLLKALHRESSPDEGVTDDGLLCERAGIEVRTVPGDPANLKVTTPTDLKYARWLVETGMIRATISE